MVKDIDDINEIWTRLKSAYGDCKLMLNKKLKELDNIDMKQKDLSKVVEGLSRIINLMKDLVSLSKQHNIQNHLFFGNTLDKIYRMLGEERLRRWLSRDESSDEGEPLWNSLIDFLEKELRVAQKSALVLGKRPKDQPPNDNSRDKGSRQSSHHTQDGLPTNGNSQSQQLKPCVICNATDHIATNGPGGSKLIQYFACPKFAAWTNSERFSFIFSKKLCFQCLFPGAEKDKGKHKEGKCQRDFICPHADHNDFTSKKHVLLCDEHKSDEANKAVLDKYKRRCILRQNQVDLPSFSKEIAIHHTFVHHSRKTEDIAHPVPVPEISEVLDDGDIETDDEPIYIFQTIRVDKERYSLFYDGGCRHFCSRHEAVLRLGDRAVEIRPGPVTIGGVCGMTSTTPYGIHQIKLPLPDNKVAKMSGVCLEQITEKFPLYPLDRIESDIRKDFIATRGNLRGLPKLGSRVGGETDFMLGMKYYRYFPKEVHRLASGLVIFKSMFENADGGYGVVGGPHPVIDMIEQQYQGEQFNLFLSSQFNIYENGYHFDPDVAMLGYKVSQDDYQTDDSDDIDDKTLEVSYCRNCASELFNNNEINMNTYFGKSIQQKMKKFQESQDVGSEIGYRCLNCRNCFDCKDQAHSALSLQEEVKQDVINRSVSVDVSTQETTASLPLMGDPEVKLAPNRHTAKKVYDRVVKKLSKDEVRRMEAVKSEAKLQALGFVDYVKNLSEAEQQALANTPVKNYIPWNIVFKEDSISTPCRIVFNASMPTESGYSLNDILAKGKKTLNSLLEIFLRWRTYRVALHSDVQKMYNAVKLQSSHWCLQRYLFEPSLDPNKEPEEKVIKTLIYGVKSSGNQAEQGLRLTADLFKDEYPDVNSIVREDTYMDDTMSGADTMELLHQHCENLQTVLNQGGFMLKGFTVSGSDPDESQSSDGVSISVSGHIWFPKTDSITSALKEMNFAKKNRGKRSEVISQVPKVIVRRLCESKVAEVFDFSGLYTPITATWKTDLHELVVKKLDWDDAIPDTLRPLWEDNFKLMGELKNLSYKRAVVPEDAVNLDIETLEFGDASKSLVCVAIYVRFKRKCGKHSCQLILGKSRLVPDTMTQPRAELFAALVNTHAAQVVKRALSKHHKDYTKFTDSQIALNWICNDALVLKEQYIRNRSIEINRWTEKTKWFFVSSEDMVADIGNRPCRTIHAVDQDSVWINGFDWMTGEKNQFPTLTLAEINAKNNQANYLITNEVEDYSTYVTVISQKKKRR